MAEDAKTPKPRQSFVEQPATSTTASKIPSTSPILPPGDSRSRPDGPPEIPVSAHILTWWFGLMALGGVGFGLVAERRPFGNGVLAYPLVVFFACVAVVLLTMRLLYAKPVPQVISERYLAAGCVIGAACFLIGNWFGVNLDRMP
jgi:hypothetical protein